MTAYRSWGNYPSAQQVAHPLSWRSDPLPEAAEGGSCLPFGQGRSYGDSCLNDGGTLLPTARLNHFLAFDRTTGILRCESGVTLDEILRLIVPQGWFLPVTPGTRFVSVGGAIANDIHGKNHHRAGTFGCHVRSLDLLRSDGSRRQCSRETHADWFRATIGGLGLTGLIASAEIQLKPIMNPLMMVETIKFGDVDEFLGLALASESDHEYTVAWIDCRSQGSTLGRGHFIRANHAGAQPGHVPSQRPRRRLTMPVYAPGFVLNHYTIAAFNALYFHRQRRKHQRQLVHYEPFFYPLDAISHWNRIYGRRGFFQYQCVVPYSDDLQALKAILKAIADAREGSFLSVLKTFGAIRSPGMLSFPRPGVTLALDFPNRGPRTLALLERLDGITRAHGGAVYPAKDARMSARSFQHYYPQWSTFSDYVDHGFSSSFWRRVSQARSGDSHAKSTDHRRDLGHCPGKRKDLCG